MNHQLPEPIRAPTPFSTPRKSDSLQRRSPLPAELILHRPGQERSAGDKTLARLTQESFEAGYAAGASNGLAIDAQPHAISNDDPCVSNSLVTGLIDALTPRRLEVLKLVARGLTNPEIAGVLGISANTIKAHLAGILETLDLTNRTEAAMALQDYEAERRISLR
jgi:DNA-binding NarL/FixJ family response regulator